LPIADCRLPICVAVLEGAIENPNRDGLSQLETWLPELGLLNLNIQLPELGYLNFNIPRPEFGRHRYREPAIGIGIGIGNHNWHLAIGNRP